MRRGKKMSVATITREGSTRVSDELINTFLTLESLTNMLRMSETVAKFSTSEYELLMDSLIEEYDKKI
jgi:hypothetical protein